MSQPKQPVNDDVVSIFIFIGVLIIIFLRDVFLQANFSYGVLIINALTDRHLVTLLFDQNSTDWTDGCPQITGFNLAVGQFSARRINDQMRIRATP